MGNQAKCYVVMADEDSACACMVIEGSTKRDLSAFLREYAGREIRTMTAEDSAPLLTAYSKKKRAERATEAREPELPL